MLTFYRKEPFSLEAYYNCPNELPYPDPTIGETRPGFQLLLVIIVSVAGLNGSPLLYRWSILFKTHETSSDLQMACHQFFSTPPHPTGQFFIQKVVPQASGESSKVKVKVRVNIHGIFSVSSASLVEVHKTDEAEEPMEMEQANDKEEQVWPHQSCFLLWKTGLDMLYGRTTCATTVFMVGPICLSEPDADRSGRAAESGRQPQRT